MNSEKGQTFPLALVALAVGSLVISPFLGHASSMLNGSRIYGQAMTEQYSCDAGIEWALWRLMEDPLLTTGLDYDSTPLEPLPSEINSSSFPTTEIKFVVDSEVSETETLEWISDPGWKYVYWLEMPGPGTINLAFETEANHLKVWLDQTQVYNEIGPPYDELELVIDPDDYDYIQVQTPSDGVLVTMTVTFVYAAAVYDIRAQKEDTSITARAEASYLGVGVISWQVE